MNRSTYAGFSPLNDKLLLKDVSTEESVYGDSGIARVETYRLKSHEGLVLAMGRKAAAEGDVRVGDVVMYSEFGAEDKTINGEPLLLVRYMDLKGVSRVAKESPIHG